jgi:hypothetical protein
LIAPAAMLAKAITQTIRAAFRPDSAFASVTRTSTGLEGNSLWSHRGCADISRSFQMNRLVLLTYPRVI